MRKLMLLVLGLAACGGRAEGPSAYVLLDRDAREAGLKIEVGGQAVQPLLPLALRPEEDIALLTPSGRLPVGLVAEELLWLHGADATSEHAPAAREQVIVDGDAHAVGLLAEMLGGTSSARPDGSFALSAPDLIDRGSFLDAPAGVLEARPIFDDAHAGARVPLVGLAHPTIAPAPSGPTAPILTSVVGVYDDGLILDLDGGFSLEGCRGALHGRYTVEDGAVLLTFADGSTRVVPMTELEQGGAE